MRYINKRNLYLRVGLVALVGVCVAASLFGGTQLITAAATGYTSDLPAEYNTTNPLTDERIQANSLAIATLNQEYTIKFSSESRADRMVLSNREYFVSADLKSNTGLKKITQSGRDTESKNEEIYETQSEIITNSNGSISSESKSTDSVQSNPILENNLRNANRAIIPFAQFTWSLQSYDSDSETATYTLSRADSANIEHIDTIQSAYGKLVIDTENEYVTDAMVVVTGTHRSQPNAQLVTTNYQYTADTTATVSQPDWVRN